MKTLKELIKNPKVRFKTIGEMITDYGTNWMDECWPMEPADAVSTLSHYAGKVFYKDILSSIYYKLFVYGPFHSTVHINMLTTHAMPKYDSRGDQLKPGMIVKVGYFSPLMHEKPLVNSDLRNIPGTLVTVLKIVDPADYLLDNVGFDKYNINKCCIATELNDCFSGRLKEYAYNNNALFFKGNRFCAFEIAHRVEKATDLEKEFYHKMKWG